MLRTRTLIGFAVIAFVLLAVALIVVPKEPTIRTIKVGTPDTTSDACPVKGAGDCRTCPTVPNPYDACLEDDVPSTTVPVPTTEPPPPPPPPTPPPYQVQYPNRTEYWYAMGRCEQPGSGEGGVDWTAHDNTYQGGLGFYHGTWDQWRRGEFAEEAWQASPAEQMIVADRVYDDVGASAWGCSRVVGLRP